MQAIPLLEAPDIFSIKRKLARDFQRSLSRPGMVPACYLLMQASHDCSHVSLFESKAWQDQKHGFQMSSMMQKYFTGDTPFWKEFASSLGVPELSFMVVYIRDAMSRQQMNGATMQLGQQTFGGDRAMEAHSLFAESVRTFTRPLARHFGGSVSI